MVEGDVLTALTKIYKTFRKIEQTGRGGNHTAS